MKELIFTSSSTSGSVCGANASDHYPLIVDLDNTLIKTDLLLEQMIQWARSRPGILFLIPFLLLKGRAEFKKFLSSKTAICPELLPFRKSVLSLIENERAKGNPVFLVSASPDVFVKKIGVHLGCFDGVLGSKKENLKGRRKLKAIQEDLGLSEFCYVGDSQADIPLWLESKRAIAVNPSWRVRSALKKMKVPVVLIRDRKPLLSVLMKQLRVHQWSKNSLIFVPLIAGHFFWVLPHWKNSIIAFLSFSFLASTIYLFNDLWDLESDRRHASKCLRPLAVGDLSLKFAFILGVTLIVLAIGLASQLPSEFGVALLFYSGLNLLYTLKLKQTLILDVVVLASFYSLRILAGGASTGIPVSEWLFAFSTFFFFGLAMVKRYTEISKTHGQSKIHGRSYQYSDQPVILVLGVCSSLLSVLVMVLYLNSPAARLLYQHPDRLWLVTPALLYWISRLWILGLRNQIHDDPVVFAMEDKVSWVVLTYFFIILYLSL